MAEGLPRHLKHDPKRQENGRNHEFQAGMKISEEELLAPKTMTVSGGKGLPAQQIKHVHHQKSAPRSRRAK
jgi:hypothetical protein